jgi:hypothetical protein
VNWTGLAGAVVFTAFMAVVMNRECHDWQQDRFKALVGTVQNMIFGPRDTNTNIIFINKS